MTGGRDDIRELFRNSGFALTERQADQFARYYDLLVENNRDRDLTRITSFEDIVVKHFIDSVYFTGLVKVPSPLLDIGTGAGFPGIPLKIMDPGLRLVMSEPRKKRVAFLEMAVRELGLKGVEVYPHMVTARSFFEVAGAVTRALEPIDDTLSRVAHFLPRGGRVLFMKGPEADRDIAALSEANAAAYSLAEDRDYALPGTTHRRRIVVYEKTSSSTSRTYSILKDLTATAGTAITSPENASFRELKRLNEGDGMRKSGRALIAGRKIVSELLSGSGVTVRQMVLCDSYEEGDDRMNAAIGEFDRGGSLLVLKKALFNELDLFNTRGPLLVVDLPEIADWDRSAGPGCTLLVPFQDPANVGSAIRSAAGFGVKDVVILKEAAHPFHPKAVRASAGAVFSVRIMRGPALHELQSVLGAGGPELIALDRGGRPLPGISFPERFLLLPGIEGPGLPDELKARSVAIPLADAIESLNAPVALSIALYEWRRHSPSY
jgi:16S rRNA (guanine(527)-N(7))-methyltransferase RsmG